jgi:hypothetical protein
MSSLHFSLSLLLELYIIREKNYLKHLFNVLIFSFGIYTTGSITGYLLLIMIFGVFILRIKVKSSIGFTIKQIIVCSFIFIGFILGFSLFKDKFNSESGSRRLEDIVNCFNAWCSSPIIGIGGGDYAENLLSGSSNSLFRLFAERGVIGGGLYLFCILKFYINNKKELEKKIFTLFFIYIFTITSMQYTNVMFMLIGYFYTNSKICAKK